MQEWRRPSNAILKRAPKEVAHSNKYDFVIMVPCAEKTTDVAAMLLRAGKPACILIPMDLVHYTSQQPGGGHDKQTELAIAECKQLVLTAPCMMWICHNTGIPRNNVFMIESETPLPRPTDREGSICMLEDWIREQPGSMTLDGKAFPVTKLTRTDSGLHMVLSNNNVTRIYVPTSR